MEEGYDLSDYTWEEMYEAYGYVVEQMAGEFPDLVTPVVTAGLGAATYLGGKVWDAAKKMFVSRSKTKPQEPDYGQTSFSASKETPAQRRERVAARVVNRKQQGDTEKKDTPKPEEVAKREARQKIKIEKPQVDLPKPPKENTAKDLGGEITRQSTTPGQSSTSSTGASGGGKPPAGPEKPTIDPLKTVKDLAKKAPEALNQTLEKPAREIAFGTTRAGQLTRGATVAGVSALDIGGKIADPSKPSALSAVGSVGPGAAGTLLQGAGNIPGIKGLSLGTGARGTGTTLRQVGREMRDQTKTTTSAPVGTPGQSPTVPAGMKIIKGPDGKNKVVPAESFDLFDVVKGHLLDEGYADTEEAALKIMANMSEDWRESIVEQIVYGGVKTTDTPADSKPKTMVITAADKAGNTKAYQNFKAGDPRYSAASHLKGV